MKDLDKKKIAAQKALPEIRSLINKHSFEVVNYVWQKVIAKERMVASAKEKARQAQEEVVALESQLDIEL